MAKKIALLIGNDEYSDPHFAELTVPLNDVRDLEQVLKRADISGFDDVKVLPNPTYAVVQQEIGALFANKSRDDAVLLYFSGHGLLDSDGELYLALKETQYRQPLGTALGAFFIKAAMNKCRSRRQVLILDACHSGAFERGTKGIGSPALTEATFEVRGYGREILTSSAATQRSWEGDQVIGKTDRSLFTHYLVEGLESGEAAEGKEEVTVEQLYHYAHDRVVNVKPEMKPQRWVDRQQGTFVIARNPHPVIEPSPLPEEVREDLNHPRPHVREGAVRELARWLCSDDPAKAMAAETALKQHQTSERDRYVFRAIEEALDAVTTVRVSSGEATLQPTLKPVIEEAGKVIRDALKDGGQGPAMVVIPAGHFDMGSPKDEESHDSDEEPIHPVTIAQPFAMGKYAVTFADYDRFAKATRRNKPDDGGWGRGDQPVINVAWGDAVAYAQWLSEQTGKPYRLPSEAEWEYAARAGTTTPFHFGETISTNQANYDGDYTYGSGSTGDYREQTMEVGHFPPNAWGLHEVHGNVWEWVQDCWNEGYQGAPDDGLAWTTGECERRVRRGGSWSLKPWYLRSAHRNWSTADLHYGTVGFRLARDLE